MLTGCLYPYFDTLFADFAPLDLPQGQMYRQPVNIHMQPCQKDTKKVPKGAPREPQGHLKAHQSPPKYHKNHEKKSANRGLETLPKKNSLGVAPALKKYGFVRKGLTNPRILHISKKHLKSH